MKNVSRICLVVLSLFSFAACQRKANIAEIDLTDTIEIKDAGGRPLSEINICVGSMVTPKEGFVYYKELLNYISDALGAKVNFIEKASYSGTNLLLEEGKIDVAFVCGGPYIDGHDKFGLQLLVAPQVGGKKVYHSYIIVRKDSDIKRLEDLRGKTFVFVDPMSNSGKIYPTYLLKQMGDAPETFFKEYLYSYAHDTSIRAVSEGIVDAGAVDSLVWHYLEKNHSPFTQNTRIIKVSPPYGIPPVVVRPRLEKHLKDRIKQVLLGMHQDKKGKVILENMSIDRFVEIGDADYDSIRKMKNM